MKFPWLSRASKIREFQNEELIRARIENAQSQIIKALSNVDDGQDAESLNLAFKEVATAIGRALQYKFCEISIIKRGEFVDFDLYLDPKLGSNLEHSSAAHNLDGQAVSETFAWQVIKENKDIFSWDLKLDGPIVKNSKLRKKYPSLNKPKYFRRLNDYFSNIFPSGIEQLLVVPLYFKYGESLPLGAIVLCNRNEIGYKFSQVESNGLMFISKYIGAILEGYLNVNNANSINRLVGKLYHHEIEESLRLIQNHLLELFNGMICSFWIPSFQEKNECIALRKIVGVEHLIPTYKLEMLRSADYYQLSNTFLSKEKDDFISDRRGVVKIHYLDEVQTGFRHIKETQSDRVVTVMVSDSDRGDPYEVLGIFCIYPTIGANISDGRHLVRGITMPQLGMLDGGEGKW